MKSYKLSGELVWKAGMKNETASVFLSFDSRFVAVTGAAGEVRLLNASSGAEIFTADLASPLIHSQVDDVTGDIFVFGRNLIARLDGAGKTIWRKNIQTPIIAGAVSQFSKNFIICYEGNRIVVADYSAAPRFKGGIESKGPITGIYSPKNSGNMALVTLAGDVFLVREDSRIIWQYCICDPLTSVSMSGDGKIIFIGSRDNKVLCLHAEQKVIFNFALKSPVLCTDISEDGKFFAVGCSDGNVYVLDASGQTIFFDKPFSTVSKVYLTDNASRILTLSDEREVSMFRIGQRKTAEEKSRDMAEFIELGDAQAAGGKFEKASESSPGIKDFIEF